MLTVSGIYENTCIYMHACMYVCVALLGVEYHSAIYKMVSSLVYVCMQLCVYNLQRMKVCTYNIYE